MKRYALALGLAVASLAMIGGAASAAVAPAGAGQALAETGPPLARLQALLGKLVDDGTLTTAQRDTIVARLDDALGAARERRPASHPGAFLAGAMKAAAAYLGMTERELGAALRDGKSIAALAAETGRARDGAIAAITADATARIDAAVTAGTLGSDQAAKLKAQLAERVSALVDRAHEAKRPKAPERRDRAKDRGPDVQALLRDHFRTAVAYLGLPAQAVTAELRAGKSLAEIAAANGKDRAGLIAALVAPANAKLDELVAGGKLTADRAAKAKEQATTLAGKLVDAKRAAKPETRRGDRPPRPSPSPKTP